MMHYAWLRHDHLRAKHAYGSSGAMRLISDPHLLMRYRADWREWVAGLPVAVRALAGKPPAAVNPLWKAGLLTGSNPAPGGEPTMPPVAESALAHGISRCAKWSALETVVAFFGSVSTALCVTPTFSMVAIALFTRSLIISYLALYTLLAMVLALLGVMHVLGLPLGVTGALALSLVIGMSVDYLIHLAHAYKNSLFADRFYKSRAAVFARTSSIVSAASTTLPALAPLPFSHLLPLREFGQIFFLVTIISFAFSVAFLVALMAVGPLRTRGLANEEQRMADNEEAPPRVTEAHSEGDGWAMQLNVGSIERAGPRSVHGVGESASRIYDAQDDERGRRQDRAFAGDDEEFDEML